MAGLFDANSQLQELLERQRLRNQQQQQQFGQLYGQAAGNRRQAAANTIGAQVGASFGQGLASGVFGEPEEIQAARTEKDLVKNAIAPLASENMGEAARLDATGQKFLKLAQDTGNTSYFTQGMELRQRAVELAKAEQMGVRDVERRSKYSKLAEERGRPVLSELVKNPDYPIDKFGEAFAPNKTKLDRYAVTSVNPDGTETVVDYVDVGQGEELPDLPQGLKYTTITGGRTSPLVEVRTGDEGPRLTPFEEKRDKEIATEVIDWTFKGQGIDVMSQLSAIAPVLDALEKGKPLTGLVTGNAPDIILAIANPTALDARENIESVVQRNLKAILGAQFTEKEGERLINRAYNPRLSPEINAKRVRRLFNQMHMAALQKDAMVKYMNKNGTLKGYQGEVPTLTDFYSAVETVEPTKDSSQDTPPTSRFEIIGEE